jgi:hypothetical protein
VLKETPLPHAAYGCRPFRGAHEFAGKGRRLSALAFAVAVALGGCGSSARRSVPLDRWLSYNLHTKSATLTLVPSANGNFNGFNFNGYGRGEVLVQVPRGWRITVDCLNDVSKSRHSCAIVRDAGNQTAPVFPGAATPDPQTGLAPGRSARFSFVATRLGAYRIACLVPTHELMGMWDGFEISSTRHPSVTQVRTYAGEAWSGSPEHTDAWRNLRHLGSKERPPSKKEATVT